MKTFAIGDIHGGHKALVQCLDRALFNYDEDRLISLGDVSDGWPDTAQCCEELSEVKNLILCMGNHDWWTDQWLRTGWHSPIWEEQGGRATQESFRNNPDLLVKHRHFFSQAKIFHIDEEDRLYVHGGFTPGKGLDRHTIRELIWDRDLIDRPPEKPIREFNEIYVGHTTVHEINDGMPLNIHNIWAMDTGGGYEGKLSMIDVGSKEIFQSDMVMDLYPEARGRN